MAGVWQDQGHRVSVLNGPAGKCEADLIINHIDLTVTPVDHLAYLRCFPKALNVAVVDISKRMISKMLVRKGEPYHGRVIVKSDLNSSGSPEASLALKGLMPPSYCQVLPAYHVFDGVDEVPEVIWNHRAVIVERFVPERSGEFYCLRTWVFCGDRESNSLSFAQVPIIKQKDVVRRDVVPEVPDELRQMRDELGFDYGKFDYGIVDGEVILYDANRTPSLGTFRREEFMPRVRHYAEGLASFL